MGSSSFLFRSFLSFVNIYNPPSTLYEVIPFEVIPFIYHRCGLLFINKSPWRNRLARPTVNREVGSSSLPGDVCFLDFL
ncbi:hypothetical protein ACN38_g6355 [Penicillium nordicum]|uniref:Uncharacterized protein n=1 Tax=Penicillium nordicum TaxID=229535 RepID=A0A0M8P8S2_9EURO|nr:hypothetical protein ACN38_g6355 [Penicillium nordicum]